MSKINSRYQSLYEYLVLKSAILWKLDGFFYPDEHASLRTYGRRFNLNPHRWEKILGGFQPIVDMGKDFVDTFKPYKTAWHVWRDFFQPLRGLGNIAKGIVNIALAPLLFLANTVRYMFVSGSLDNYGYNMKLNSVRTISWLIDGVSSVIRGVSQIVTTPLSWLIKMPLRGIITLAKGSPKIEDSSSLKKLLEIGVVALQANEHRIATDIVDRMHVKYQKGLRNGQDTQISASRENKEFRESKGLQYLGLFAEKITLNETKMKPKNGTSIVINVQRPRLS